MEEHRTKGDEKHLHQQPGSFAVNKFNPQPKEHGSLVRGTLFDRMVPDPDPQAVPNPILFSWNALTAILVQWSGSAKKRGFVSSFLAWGPVQEIVFGFGAQIKTQFFLNMCVLAGLGW